MPIEHLDLATAIEVSQVIGREMTVDRLIDVLLRTAIEHSAAERGVLLLRRGETLEIRGQGLAMRQTVTVRPEGSATAIPPGELPKSILLHVLRNRESVILDDASAHPVFSADGYVRTEATRSVLCLPLMTRAALIGVLYLERNGLTRAFTPDRIVVLKLIASQAAVALENAQVQRTREPDRDDMHHREARVSKMEAIGRLAGGIAHDFNNILGAILGYGELARDGLPDESDLRRYVNNVMLAALRGRALVGRILNFSGGIVNEHVRLSVQAIVEEVLVMLEPSLPPGITVESRLDAPDAAVMGDATQLHEVAMNLCVNGLQAMERGGTLAVTLGCQRVQEDCLLSHATLHAGRYVRLSVSDNGTGMGPEVLERVFDPFFTTKRPGEGTGLGLAMVQGIVSDFGGAIDVSTQVGLGSTFTVWLPEAKAIARLDDAPHGADA
jgi:signal transduction histidine kinase